VSITDANGCVSTSSASITEPASLQAFTLVDNQVSCNGLSDGGASASASGGISAYTFLWSNGASTATINNVTAGTYTVTVTDAHGCTSTSSATITEPAILQASSVVSSTLDCNGDTDGQITASATGGTTAYIYLWNTGGTTALETGLGAGTYTVTVTDNHGCTSTSSVTVTEPATLLASTSVDTNVSCNGYADGGATASVSGGTSPYTYLWNNSATTATIVGVLAGTYSVTITDNNGCTSTSSTIITEPALLVATTSLTNDVSCAGLSDGAASVSVSGGTSPYTYIWINSATTASIVGVLAGTYSVTVSDQQGCGTTGSIAVGTVVDVTDPDISDCPANITVSNDPGMCNAVVTWSVPTATDNCDLISFTPDYASGSTFQKGTTTVTYTATDASGNTATCSFTVTVTDDEDPTITCASNIELWICAADSTITVGAPTTGDNCGVANTLNNYNGGSDASDTYGVGTTAVLWTVTDNSGNTATCTQTVTFHQKPTPVVTILGDTELCIGDALELSLEPTIIECPTCTIPTNYCASMANLSNLMHISEVSYSGVNNTSGQSQYSDYTGSVNSLEVFAGSMYQLSVTTESYFGNQGTVKLHVDWNRDGAFEYSAQATLTSQDATHFYYTIVVHVPLTASVGNTAMRFVLSSNANQAACGNYPYGETEDYAVTTRAYDNTDFVQFRWMNNASMVWTDPVLSVSSVTDLHNGSYYVTVTNADGCWNTAQTTVQVTNPQITLVDTIMTMYPESLVLDVGAFDTYYWNTGSTQNPFQVPAYGTYHVRVTENGCLTRDTIVIGERQDIFMPHGWSTFSSYIDFTENMETLLLPLEPEFALVKDGNGNIYWPFVGVNTIGSTTQGQAYQIRTFSDQWLFIEGSALDPATVPISLNANHNLMGYLHKAAAPIVDMTSAIQSLIINMQDDEGKIYWPSMGVNQIGNMLPGEGYNINMSAAANFTYPPVPAGAKGIAVYETPDHFRLDLITGANMVVALPANAWNEEVNAGDEVGAFNSNGQLVGAGVYDGSKVVITVWGDDEIDKGKAMKAAAPIEFRHWSQSTGKEETIHINDWKLGDGSFHENTAAIAAKIGQSEQILSNEMMVYPNPARSVVTIEYSIQTEGEVVLKLMNALGEEVQLIFNGNMESGVYSETLDLSEFQSGVYFIELHTSSGRKVEKINKL